MFATRTFGALHGGRNSLDVPVASLAGLAVAFLSFAAPADLLAGLVVATGLPDVIPAAAPPLGFNARIALVAGGAMGAFTLALLFLRLLGRLGRREEEGIATDIEPPRLRRRDIHPDEPSRPPLLAVHELGEPEPEPGETESETKRETTPLWLQEAALLLARKPDRASKTEEPEEWPDTAVADRSDALAFGRRSWPDPGADPEPEPEFEAPQWVAPAPTSEPWSRSPVEPERMDGANDHWPPETAAERDARLEPLLRPAEPKKGPQAVPFDPVPTAPAAVHTSPPKGSIAELLERLERAVARQRMQRSLPEGPAPAVTPEPAPVRAVAPDAGDDRLQSAIESLQRFASRQN